MLFGSFEFLLAFLPVTLAGYHWLRVAGRRTAAKQFLLLASLFFYGWWDVRYVLLILSSIAVNYLMGLWLESDKANRRWVLTAGIAFNLILLGYYKYASFFVANLAAATGLSFALGAIVLPIGISFFTFQQLAYLVDTARDGRSEKSILNYALFVLFFPHLIAGPITHPREMLPQFDAAGGRALDVSQLNIGICLLIIGLAKKSVMADTLASLANPVFGAADLGQPVSTAAAWMGALAYTFQLYFDFSGYSDMAIGLGLLFGIRLPVNFASPYKSTSIIEFWRRWHITLSRFLRNYIYIPLGGNRKGTSRRYANLIVAMGLGGLWHGAAWTFVVWGLLHGAYLVINNFWSQSGRRLPSWLAWGTTFLAVVVGWVLFRANTSGGALAMLTAMIELSAGSPEAASAATPLAWAGVAIAGAIALLPPNSIELVGYEHEMPNAESDQVPLRSIEWKLSPVAVVVGLGVVTALVIAKLPQPGVFIYFNF